MDVDSKLLINKRSRKHTPVERCPTSNTLTPESTEKTLVLAASAPTPSVSSESTTLCSADDALESRQFKLASERFVERNLTYTQK